MEKLKNYIIVGLLVLVGTSFTYAMKPDQQDPVVTKSVPVVAEQSPAPEITPEPAPTPVTTPIHQPAPPPKTTPIPVKTVTPKPVATSTPEPAPTPTCSESKKFTAKTQEDYHYQDLVYKEEVRFNLAVSKISFAGCNGGIYQSSCGIAEQELSDEKQRYGQTILKLAQDHKANLDKIESICF